MFAFIIKRLVHLIPILLGVSLLTRGLMELTPGDYFTTLQQNPQISPELIAKLRAEQHYDKPWYIQYLYWLKNVAHGDLGYSVQYKTDITGLITGRLWNTFLLSLGATILAWCVAVPLGIWAAVKKGSWVDHLCSFIAFTGLSIPDVLLSLLALMFAASTGWFPVGGAQSPLYDILTPSQQIWDRFHHLILRPSCWRPVIWRASCAKCGRACSKPCARNSSPPRARRVCAKAG